MQSTNLRQERTAKEYWGKSARRCLRVVIFDGDDTLWKTQELYDHAKTAFARLVAGLGYEKKSVITELDRIDAANVSTHGFSRRRFPRSLVQTYRVLAGRSKQKPDKRVEDQIRHIGNSVFRKKPKLAPFTHSVLRRLKKEFRLVLFTKGDASIQKRRIRQTGLRELFDAVYITEYKKIGDLRDVLRAEGVRSRDAIMVGDSVRSDIRPAITLGMRAIWINGRTWRYEYDDLPATPRVVRARSLRDIAKILRG